MKKVLLLTLVTDIVHH